MIKEYVPEKVSVKHHSRGCTRDQDKEVGQSTQLEEQVQSPRGSKELGVEGTKSMKRPA